MPRDLKLFLNWYLSPFSRMKRGVFNVLVFALSIVVFVVSTNTSTGVPEGRGGIDPKMIMNLMQNMSASANGSQEALNRIAELQKAMDYESNPSFDVDTDTGFDLAEDVEKENRSGYGINWSGFLAFIMFMAVLPLFWMRLRDMGKNAEQVRLYSGLAYAGIVSTFLKDVLHLPLPFVLTLLLGATSFFVTAWICMQGSEYIPLSQRKDV